MTLSEFTAEIHTDLESFSDSSDIDNISIKLWVIDRLRKFGLDICHLEEAIINIQNSQGSLPDQFRSLKLALWLDPVGHNQKHRLQTDNYIYRQRIENPAYFDSINQEYIRSCYSSIITETITIGETPVEFYHKYKWLSLVKGVNKSIIANDCFNLHPSIRNTYKHQINITGSTINCNFPTGNIYVQYHSLPMEDGEISIPELTTGDILDYVKKYVKVQIVEKLIANNKNPQGVAQLYPLWIQELPQLKRAAIVEAKFYGLGKDWAKKYKQQSRRETVKYNLPKLRF